MQMDPEEYARLEEDWNPCGCSSTSVRLFEWNYQDISRLAMNTPQSPQSQLTEGGKARSTFGEQLQAERLAVGQTLEGLSTLLGIPVDYYQALEEGVIPPDELLRKICSMFEWNYRQVRQRRITSTNPSFGGYQPPLSAREIRNRFPNKPDTPEWNEVPPENRFSWGKDSEKHGKNSANQQKHWPCCYRFLQNCMKRSNRISPGQAKNYCVKSVHCSSGTTMKWFTSSGTKTVSSGNLPLPA